MRARNRQQNISVKDLPGSPPSVPLWQLGIAELTGHNIEAHGREAVNQLLAAGWILLHIYTLRYEENGVWRERPMAILGRPKGAGADPETSTPERQVERPMSIVPR